MNDKTIKITKKIYSKYSISDIEKRFRLLGDEDFNSVLKFLNIYIIANTITKNELDNFNDISNPPINKV